MVTLPSPPVQPHTNFLAHAYLLPQSRLLTTSVTHTNCLGYAYLLPRSRIPTASVTHTNGLGHAYLPSRSRILTASITQWLAFYNLYIFTIYIFISFYYLFLFLSRYLILLCHINISECILSTHSFLLIILYCSPDRPAWGYRLRPRYFFIFFCFHGEFI